MRLNVPFDGMIEDFVGMEKCLKAAHSESKTQGLRRLPSGKKILREQRGALRGISIIIFNLKKVKVHMSQMSDLTENL